MSRSGPPLAYPPERCEFSDLSGNETLTINHGVRQEHITTIGAFSQSEQREFQANPTELRLTHDSKVFGKSVKGIKLVWRNKCFADGRIAADLSKMALAAGPLRQRSFLEEIGANQEEEWARKETEGAKSKK